MSDYLNDFADELAEKSNIRPKDRNPLERRAVQYAADKLSYKLVEFAEKQAIEKSEFLDWKQWIGDTKRTPEEIEDFEELQDQEFDVWKDKLGDEILALAEKRLKELEEEQKKGKR